MSSDDEHDRDAAQQPPSSIFPPPGAVDGAAALQEPEIPTPQLLAGGGVADATPIGAPQKYNL